MAETIDKATPGSRGQVFLLVALALGSLVAPVLLLGLGGTSGHGLLNQAWRTFANGGGGMWLILLLLLALAPTVLVLGVLVTRGKRVPGGLLLAGALGPIGVGLVASISGMALVSGAVSGASVDPALRGRIVAHGLAETLGLSVFGGAASACIAGLVAAAYVLSLVPSATPSWTGASAGLVATGGAVVVRLVLRAPMAPCDGLVLAGLVASAAGAACASSTLRARLDAGDEEGASHAWRSLALAAAATMAAVVLLDRASVALHVIAPLEGAAGPTTDPVARATLLAEAAATVQRAHVVTAVDAAAALACYAPALFAGATAQRKVSRWGALPLVTALAVGAAAFALWVRTTSAVGSLGAAYAALEPADVVLPVLPSSSGQLNAPATQRVLVVKRDATVDASRLAAVPGIHDDGIALVLDGRSSFDAWGPAVEAAVACRDDFCPASLVAAPLTRADKSHLGPFLGFAGTDLFRLAVEVRGKKPPRPTPASAKAAAMQEAAEHAFAGIVGASGALAAVLDDGKDARLFAAAGSPLVRLPGDVVRVPLGSAPGDEAARKKILEAFHRQNPKASRFLLSPAPGADSSRVATVVVALGALRVPASSSYGQPYALAVALTPDRASLEAVAAP